MLQGESKEEERQCDSRARESGGESGGAREEVSLSPDVPPGCHIPHFPPTFHTCRFSLSISQRRPLSAFRLFAFAQHALLRRQSAEASAKEMLKVIGERWILMTEADQQVYEQMAALEGDEGDDIM